MSKFYSALKYVVLLLLAATLLYFSFKEVKMSDFVVGLKSCDFRWIIASMLISVFAFYVRGARWRLIMLPLNPNISRRDAFDGVTVAYLTNFAIPRAGEIARCGVITKKRGVPFESVAGTVVLERSIDMICLILITVSLLFFSWDIFGSFINKEILGAIENKFSVNLFAVMGIALLAFAIFGWILYKYRSSHPFLKKMTSIIKGLIAGLLSGFKMPQKWLFLFYTILLWVCYWLMSYTTILAFPGVEGLGALDALFLMVVGGIGWVIPVQGGIGAYHFIISLALASVYGISQTTGVVFATISHESQALTMIVCGLFSLASIALSKRGPVVGSK